MCWVSDLREAVLYGVCLSVLFVFVFGVDVVVVNSLIMFLVWL